LIFTDALREAGISGSIGSVGDALDNALIESAIGLFKTELIARDPGSWSGRAEVARETASWGHWYNTARLHGSLGHRPPVEFEEHYRSNTDLTSEPEVA
jgi:putative transposase